MSDPLPAPGENQSLIVPLRIKILWVPKVAGSEGAASYPALSASSDFTLLPYWDSETGEWSPKAYLSKHVNAFSEGTLEAGVHLHWILPRALSHGADTGSGTIGFPNAPNRWLVTRAQVNAAASAPKRWVIESDVLETREFGADPVADKIRSNKIRVSTPISITNTQTFSFLGKAFDFAAPWKEGGVAGVVRIGDKTDDKWLKVYGYGEPSFAAYYQNCRNVFGFYDVLDEVNDWDSAVLSYQVIGWYSETPFDPVAGRSLLEIGQSLGWVVDGTSPQIKPRRTVLNGVIQSVRLRKSAAALSDQPLRVAVGNTTAEAVSALAADLMSDQPESSPADGEPSSSLPDRVESNDELLLNALQAGWLTRLTGADSLAEMEEALHQQAFCALPGGWIWSVRKKETQPPTVTARTNGTSPSAPKIPDYAAVLNQLNVDQQNYDRMVFQIDSLRRQIFADWYKYMVLAHEHVDPTLSPPSVDDARGLIKQQIARLSDLVALAGELQVSITSDAAQNVDYRTSSGPRTLAAKLVKALGDLTKALGDDYLPQRVPGTRFWQPVNPVLLLYGKSAQPDEAPAPQDSLVCRLSRELISGIRPYRFSTSEWPVVKDAAAPQGLPEIRDLWIESVFLDPDQAERLAASTQDVTADQIRTVQEQLLGGSIAPADNPQFVGKKPADMSIRRDANGQEPWHPLYMQWSIQYAAVRKSAAEDLTYSQDFVSRSFVLDRDCIDLTLAAPDPANLMEARTYRGIIPLSPQASNALKAQIDSFLSYSKDPELSRISQSLHLLPMLCQAVSGFNDALLMQKQVLQLRIHDPAPITDDDKSFCNQAVPAAVNGLNEHAPDADQPFNPIRAGFITGLTVTIIDSFGRTQTVSNPALIRASSFRLTRLLGAKPSPLTDSYLFLPPRLAQPARLLFRWLSGTDGEVEMNDHPATTPIFGWVLPNNLEGSLMLYGPDGAALGSLVARGSEVHFEGSAATFEQDSTTALKDHPLLLAFAQGFQTNGASYLQSFRDVADTALANIEPENYRDNPALAVLIGRPLALAQASLVLELQGLPACRQDWPALSTDVTNTSVRSTDNFQDVWFPVRLGDLSQVADGLVGYFLQTPGATSVDFTTFYSAAASDGGAGVTAPEADTIQLRPTAPPVPAEIAAPIAGEDNGVVVTMLLDPRAEVHATTGILPVKSIAIPADQYAHALNALAMTFLTAPILSDARPLTLPLPLEPGFQWSWLSTLDGKWSEVAGLQGSSDRAALSDERQRILEGWLKLGRTPSS